MGVVSLAFLGITVLAALALRLPARMLPRDLVLIAASAGFIFCVAGDPLATLPFWTLVLIGFLLVKCARFAARPLVLGLFAAAVVACWWWLRSMAPALLGLAPGGVAVFGLSYAMFRIIHLLIDARDEELGTPLRFRSYLCYLIFFPNYLAGPVQRYQHFAPQLTAPGVGMTAAAWWSVLWRANAGVFKCTLAAGLALNLHRFCVAQALANESVIGLSGMIALACLAFAAYVYFSFAGYMDIVISAGRVLGVAVPENFDQPLQAKNFLDLWSRWHITLSDWFRFYVFNPALKAMLANVERASLAPYLGAFGYFLAFFLMGIWHGRTPGLIAYGLVLGAGVSINKLYQVWLGKRLGRKGYAALGARPLYQLFSQALALMYFVVALCFLWEQFPEVAVQRPWLMPVAAVLVFLACMLAARCARGSVLPALPVAAACLIAGIEMLGSIAYLLTHGGKVPELIYQWL